MLSASLQIRADCFFFMDMEGPEKLFFGGLFLQQLDLKEKLF